MDLFLLNNVLHLKEQSILIPSLLQRMALVIVAILSYQHVHLTFVTMPYPPIIQMLNSNNGVPVVWLKDKGVFRLDNAKVLDLTQFIHFIILEILENIKRNLFKI